MILSSPFLSNHEPLSSLSKPTFFPLRLLDEGHHLPIFDSPSIQTLDIAPPIPHQYTCHHFSSVMGLRQKKPTSLCSLLCTISSEKSFKVLLCEMSCQLLLGNYCCIIKLLKENHPSNYLIYYSFYTQYVLVVSNFLQG